jgi:hypothetical protein
MHDKATQSDALMKYLSQQTDPVTGKPVISPQVLQDYQQHNMRQRAFVAGGITAGQAVMQSLQHLGYANRETLAKTNLYQAQAATTAAGGGVPQAGSVNIGGRKINFIQTPKGGVQVVPAQEGNPGEIIYHPETGHAIGYYDANGKRVFYPTPSTGLDINALFGTGGAPPQAAPTPSPGQPAPRGPQSTDQAYSTQGDPGNLPPYLRQQPAGQGQQGAGAQAPAQAGQVRVMHPDGVTVGYIPANQLQSALKQGYTQI